jgi:hypothetical protein
VRELQNSSTKELLPRSLDELNSVNSLHDIAHWHNSSVGTSSTTTTCWDFAAMVEGPGVHRVAVAHRRILQGRVYQANSPNGRFADGAAAINGHVLSHIEAHGKHIFYVSFCSSCSGVAS